MDPGKVTNQFTGLRRKSVGVGIAEYDSSDFVGKMKMGRFGLFGWLEMIVRWGCEFEIRSCCLCCLCLLAVVADCMWVVGCKPVGDFERVRFVGLEGAEC